MQHKGVLIVPVGKKCCVRSQRGGREKKPSVPIWVWIPMGIGRGPLCSRQPILSHSPHTPAQPAPQPQGRRLHKYCPAIHIYPRCHKSTHHVGRVCCPYSWPAQFPWTAENLERPWDGLHGLLQKEEQSTAPVFWISAMWKQRQQTSTTSSSNPLQFLEKML